MIKSALLATLMPLCLGRARAENALQAVQLQTPVSVILPNVCTLPPKGPQRDVYQDKLRKASLDFIYEHYSGSKLPVWDKPLDTVDMEKRVTNIIHWILLAVEQESETYFVDPSWIIAQIMAESFFYEFAVSEAFAVGICQFIMPTARKYGMVCPDDPRLAPSEILESDKAGELERMHRMIRKRRKLLKDNRTLFAKQERLLIRCLSALVNQQTIPEAEQWLDALEERNSLDATIAQSRRDYMDFLKANYEGKSIFNQEDLHFLVRFDERVTYRKPILAMVRMMAGHLRARNGNLLAATAGYNAGLPTTRSSYRIYKAYGGIPAIEETVKYVNLIVVNHHEIIKRM